MKLLLSLLLLIALPSLAAPQKPAKQKSPPAAAASTTPPPAAAATPAATGAGNLDPTVKTRVEEFFKIVKEHRVQDAYTHLFEGSTLFSEQPERMKVILNNTLLLIEKCGRVESASILRVRSAGPTLREITCILNCRKQPMRWTIFAFFGEGRWQVLDAEVDLDLHSFFDPEKPAAN